jgi:hypothetical protein
MCIDVATVFLTETDKRSINDDMGTSRVGCQETETEAYFEI